MKFIFLISLIGLFISCGTTNENNNPVTSDDSTKRVDTNTISNIILSDSGFIEFIEILWGKLYLIDHYTDEK